MKGQSLLLILVMSIISSCHSPKTERNVQAFVQVEQASLNQHTDSSFHFFVNELTHIVHTRDLKALSGVMAPQISESNNGCKRCTPAELVTYLESNSLDRFWESIEQTLKYGFLKIEGADPFREAVGGEEDSMYYVSPAFIQQVNLNCPDSLLVLGEEPAIFARPDSSSQPVGLGPWRKFRCNCNMNSRTRDSFQKIGKTIWVEVFLPNGQTGYIPKENTSLSISRTIYVSRFQADWKITAVYLKSGC